MSNKLHEVKAVSRIAELREKAGVTQLELSRVLGVSENTIQNWENGVAFVEQIDKIIRLCKKLNCSLEDLIDYISESSEKSNKSSSDETNTVPGSIFPITPSDLLNKVFRFIEANYYRPMTLTDIANEVGISPSYLTNLMRRVTGATVQNWVIQRRMAAARTLLEETDKSLEEVADMIGYQNVVHFFRQFRQYYGTTPALWRREQKRRNIATQHEIEPR